MRQRFRDIFAPLWNESSELLGDWVVVAGRRGPGGRGCLVKEQRSNMGRDEKTNSRVLGKE
jgi:hypothetical protein